MRVVHISDPHLTHLHDHDFLSLRGKRWLGFLSWQRRRRKIHLRNVLDRLISAVQREHADIVAVTGDLTQLGLESEVTQATRWLEELRAGALLLVPGNHDFYRPDSIKLVMEQWRSFLLYDKDRDRFPGTWTQDGLRIIGLCSAFPAPFWSAQGEIGASQLRHLDDLLRTAPGELSLLLMHHPPVSGLCAGRKALRDAPSLQAVLEKYPGNVVLHGHLHRTSYRKLGASTHVLGIASASDAASDPGAAYRVLDFERQARHWVVDSSVKAVCPDGSSKVVEQRQLFIERATK